MIRLTDKSVKDMKIRWSKFGKNTDVFMETVSAKDYISILCIAKFFFKIATT